ncbi:MAG TPA: radical SAM protein [Thermoanaerobaculaceae bacterium]|nr:radical SAM protein [Thermoanaerobaculaceae bacterium]
MSRPEPRNVHLFQPGVSHGKGNFLGYYLPYSIGCVWSYAWSRPHIRESFRLADLVFRRERPADVLARMERPAIACFSAYLWNWRWNLHVARAVKSRFPECLVVFGGPQVPERRDHTLFEQHPFIDIAVHSEGEATFLEILERIARGESLEGIAGTSIPAPDRRTIAYPWRPRLDVESEEMASPFLDGTFDALVAAHPAVHWHAVMETNRGCPFQCTFCDWGSLTYTKIKKFRLEKVFAEIEWLGRKGIDFLYLADANFGVFPDRDELIVEKFVNTRRATGRPSAVAATWHKNSNERTLQLARQLEAGGLSRGITLSVQSMNPATLKATHRENMKFSHLGHLFGLAEAAGLPAVTEMILGLPEETYDTWADGICQVLELGNHSALTFYPAELLENAEMSAPESRRTYGIRSAMLNNWAWEPDNLDIDGVEEVSEIVTGTNTLPEETYLDALMFAWMVLNLHVEGWTQLLARFVRRHGGIPYRRFYDGLRRWIVDHPESLVGAEYARMRRSWTEYFATGRPSADYRFGNIQVQGYMQIHATQYELRSRHAQTSADISAFFATFPHGLPAAVADDLAEFQERFVTRFDRPFTYPHAAGHNLWEFVRGEEELREEAAEYEMSVTEPYDRGDLEEFLNKIYFRRRAGFGKMRVRRVRAAASEPSPSARRTRVSA